MATMLSLLSTLFANVSKQGVKYCFVVRATENYHAKGLPKVRKVCAVAWPLPGLYQLQFSFSFFIQIWYCGACIASGR